jgi:hypothetical protein
MALLTRFGSSASCAPKVGLLSIQFFFHYTEIIIFSITLLRWLAGMHVRVPVALQAPETTKTVSVTVAVTLAPITFILRRASTTAYQAKIQELLVLPL